MKNLKNLKLSLAVIGLAILVSIFAFHNNTKQTPTTTDKVTAAITNPTSMPSSFLLEKINEQLKAEIESLDIKDENNLTLKLAQELADKIIDLNVNNDLSSGELVVPNEEIFSDEMMAKYKDYFLKDVPVTTLAEIKYLSEEETPFTSFRYFVEIAKIQSDYKLADDIFEERLQAFIDNESGQFLSDYIDNLSGAISALKNLATPNSYARLHVDFINLLNTKKAIMTALYNFQKDPVAALAAAQLIEDLDNGYVQWMEALVKQMQKDGSINYFKF